MANAENRKINFSGVKFTPTGGSAVNLKAVQSIDHDTGGQTIKGSGDASLFPTHVRRVFNEPTVTLATEDFNGANAWDGLVGAMEAILHDADNGATPGGGAIKLVVSNATVATVKRNAGHKKYAAATINIEASSTDGVTSPAVYTAV